MIFFVMRCSGCVVGVRSLHVEFGGALMHVAIYFVHGRNLLTD